MNLKLLLIPLFLLLRNSGSIEFSKSEWTNPSRPGSSVWLKNGKKKAVRIESVYVKNDGFRTGDEVALKLGRGTFFFTAGKGKAGQWTRLRPRKGEKKIRIRARDSLFAAGFEYGNRLKAKKAGKVLEEDYVLDLMLVDDTGDSAIVKISESAPKYIIEGALDGAALGGGREEWSLRAGLSEEYESDP
ncbi:MAG TPA: hypothetical protein VJ385_14600 [Fibrobacteria bacterium]|nr:hypothetical protein [Fibrobacteria bacterium]